MVDRATAIRLLTAQLESGQRLLKARPLTEDDHARWGLNTRHHLEKAFGRGSPTILEVIEAGVRSTCPIDADRKWWETYRAERLTTQLLELATALRTLGADPKLAIALPPAKPEKQARRQVADPDLVPSKPEKPVRRTTTQSDSAAAKAATPPPPAPVKTLGPEEHDELPQQPSLIDPEPVSQDVFSGWGSDAPPAKPELPSVKPAAAGASSEYFTGVACLNGHVVTGAAEAYPARVCPRCSRCGAGTFKTCQCGTPLRGGVYSMRLDNRTEPVWIVPNYCHSCGAAFPWSRLKREAIEGTIGELTELDATDRTGLLALVPDTIDETPKTAVAVMRWHRALAKLPAQTRALVSDLLKEVAVPLVAKHLGLVQ
jgi:hypothetical protein